MKTRALFLIKMYYKDELAMTLAYTNLKKADETFNNITDSVALSKHEQIKLDLYVYDKTDKGQVIMDTLQYVETARNYIGGDK